MNSSNSNVSETINEILLEISGTSKLLNPINFNWVRMVPEKKLKNLLEKLQKAVEDEVESSKYIIENANQIEAEGIQKRDDMLREALAEIQKTDKATKTNEYCEEMISEAKRECIEMLEKAEAIKNQLIESGERAKTNNIEEGNTIRKNLIRNGQRRVVNLLKEADKTLGHSHSQIKEDLNTLEEHDLSVINETETVEVS